LVYVFLKNIPIHTQTTLFPYTTLFRSRDLVKASISVSPAYHEKTNVKTKVRTKYYEVKNNSDLYFELELKGGTGTKRLVLYPESTQILTAEAGQSNLTYEIISTFIRSDKHLQFDINLK